MMDRALAHVRRLSRHAPRLLWAALFLIHLLPFAKLTPQVIDDPTGAAVLPWSILVLAISFFFLKTLDAAFLRWRTRRGGGLAFLLAFVLVHHEFVNTHLLPAMSEAPPAVLVAGSAAELIRRFRRHIPELLTRLIDFFRRSAHLPQAVSTISFSEAVSLSQLRAVTAGDPRAPPAS